MEWSEIGRVGRLGDWSYGKNPFSMCDLFSATRTMMTVG